MQVPNPARLLYFGGGMKGPIKRYDHNARSTTQSLALLSCEYGHKIESNGKCYSTKCAFNADPWIRKKIKKDGCTLYKNLEKAKADVPVYGEEINP